MRRPSLEILETKRVSWRAMTDHFLPWRKRKDRLGHSMLLLLWCQLSSFGRIISCCLPAHCQLGLLGIDKLASCVCIELTGLPQFAYTYRISSFSYIDKLCKDLCKHCPCKRVDFSVFSAFRFLMCIYVQTCLSRISHICTVTEFNSNFWNIVDDSNWSTEYDLFKNMATFLPKV